MTLLPETAKVRLTPEEAVTLLRSAIMDYFGSALSVRGQYGLEEAYEATEHLTDSWKAELEAVKAREEALPSAEVVARLFHMDYEDLAPAYGWHTAEATRTFDPHSP